MARAFVLALLVVLGACGPRTAPGRVEAGPAILAAQRNQGIVADRRDISKRAGSVPGWARGPSMTCSLR